MEEGMDRPHSSVRLRLREKHHVTCFRPVAVLAFSARVRARLRCGAGFETGSGQTLVYKSATNPIDVAIPCLSAHILPQMLKVDYGKSRHFCDDLVCPDPVRKPSTAVHRNPPGSAPALKGKVKGGDGFWVADWRLTFWEFGYRKVADWRPKTVCRLATENSPAMLIPLETY